MPRSQHRLCVSDHPGFQWPLLDVHDGHVGHAAVVKPPAAHGQEGCSATLRVDALLGLVGARAGVFQETREQPEGIRPSLNLP